MNILFIADPNSIHDVKWMKWFTKKEEYKCFLVRRSHHQKVKLDINITDLDYIDDYSIFKPWKNTKTSKKLKYIIKKYDIDLVHIYYAEPNLLWANITAKLKPTIVTTRGSDILIALASFYQKRKSYPFKFIFNRYKNVFEKTSHIISTSKKQTNFIENKIKTKTPLSVIRTGVDLNSILKPSQDKKIIFFPRNMTPLYQHEIALEAINKLPQNITEEYEFVFINKNGQEKNYIQKINDLIVSSKYHNSIRFLDSLFGESYYKILSESKLVIMTPKSDGTPVSGMEALAAQSNLILPDIGYDKDIFDKAYYYQKNDAEALSKCIIETLNQPAQPLPVKLMNSIDRDYQMKMVEIIYNEMVTKYIQNYNH